MTVDSGCGGEQVAKVLHRNNIDYCTACPSLALCLHELAAWARVNPRHPVRAPHSRCTQLSAADSAALQARVAPHDEHAPQEGRAAGCARSGVLFDVIVAIGSCGAGCATAIAGWMVSVVVALEREAAAPPYKHSVLQTSKHRAPLQRTNLPVSQLRVPQCRLSAAHARQRRCSALLVHVLTAAPRWQPPTAPNLWSAQKQPQRSQPPPPTACTRARRQAAQHGAARPCARAGAGCVRARCKQCTAALQPAAVHQVAQQVGRG